MKLSFTLCAFVLSLFLLFMSAACDNEKVDQSKQKLQLVTHPEWSYNKTIYEVNIRQFSDEGNFSGFKPHLDRLQSLGVGIIWLMPIHPIGNLNRKGALGSYYSVKNYKEVNPEFGTLEEFKELVKEIHSRGMYVIIDWVANHSAWDNIWALNRPDFYTKDSSGNFIPPIGTDWSDVIDLDFDNVSLWNYMINAMRFWVRECDIDGFRCDVAAMVPTEFWDKARIELNKVKPVFMLAEAYEPELHEKAFDMTYNWQLKDMMNKIATKRADVAHLDSLILWENYNYPQNAFRMNFTTNHDENSWNGTAYQRLGKGTHTFLALAGTIQGMLLIYGGQEAGLNKALEFFEKDIIVWKEHEANELLTRLNFLKMENKAMWNGEMGGELKRLKTSDDKHLFAFSRERDGSKVLALFNLSPKKLITILRGENIYDKYTDLMTGQIVSHSEKKEFVLEGWEYKIFYN
ncbi:MAG: alpha-amylase [Bacteroidetes bacterium]|nr:alpha-amylase [Bacteroidota bacterium]